MPASDTDIANDALGRLGIPPIMSLDDNAKQAQYAKRFFDQTRDEVLAMHSWNFSIRRAALSQLATPPLYEWAFAYQLPTDCIRIVQLNNYDPARALEFYVVEGGQLHTDAPSAEIRYISRVTDPTLYPPVFAEALSIKLAAKLSAPLTGRIDQPTLLMQEYDRVTGPKARLLDVFEDRRKRRVAWIDSDLVRSRMTGGF
jgi:hypothetical protein